MTNAYLIAEYNDNIVASIDIGIGIQAIYDPFVWGVIVITDSLKTAFQMIKIDMPEDVWLAGRTESSFGHNEYTTRIAVLIKESLNEPERIIGCDEPDSHWLCVSVQNNANIGYCYRYDRYDKPLWSKFHTYAARGRQPMSWIDLQGAEQQKNICDDIPF